VINEGSGAVAPATRARVVEAIERLGFRPRAAARELSQGHAETLGLVLADLTNPFFARLADRVVREARSRSVQIVLMTTQEDAHLEGQVLDTLLDRSVGGVIATPTGGNIERWRRLADLGIQMVFVDRSIEELPDVDGVSIKNVESARIATTHLLDLGHTRIGIISGPLTTSTGRARVDGYDCALRDRGLKTDRSLVFPTPFRGDRGADAVARMLSRQHPPTALIVANTAQVRVALRRLAQSAVAIPEQLSVIVFDDNPWTELVNPPLTVIRQPIDMLALHSIELLLDRTRGRIAASPRHIEVDAEFVERASTSTPSSQARALDVVAD
jgi:LacI family transcriptional regulator